MILLLDEGHLDRVPFRADRLLFLCIFEIQKGWGRGPKKRKNDRDAGYLKPVRVKE